MKNSKKIILITVVLISITFLDINAQFLNGFYNGAMPFQLPLGPFQTPHRGNTKPNTTEWNGPNPSNSYAYYPVLIVFVQFADDPEFAPFGSWPKGQVPIYLDSMIATIKNTNENISWWEKYNSNTEMISSQWMEISRGKFHVISPGVDGNGAFSVILDSAHKYSNEQIMNQVIWQKLFEQGLEDWRPYDKWTLKQEDGMFYNRGDSIVDCIYKIHRSRGRGPMPSYDGWNTLSSSGGEWLVDTANNIKANSDFSGFTVSFRGLKSQYIATCGHEHGHHTISGGHIQNGRVSYGIGFDYFLSPYEMILNEYMTTRTATFGISNSLGDYSSRNSNAEGEILKVIIDNSSGKDECFLLANRRKISRWDRVMTGDSTQIEPYDDYSELGKGLYIYHIKDGVRFPEIVNDTVQDLECADGYWEWELKRIDGRAKTPFDCFISAPDWRIFKKKNVLYTNDYSTLGQPSGLHNLGNPDPYGDEVSFFHYYQNIPRVTSLWTMGDEVYSGCELGTDGIYTNEKEDVFNNNRAGDRWDAWNVGYNEIFSPYSSPSTVKWNNDPSGIFIWYYSLNGNTADIKIFRASEYGGTTPLDSILKWTPPSRPMGIKIDTTGCINDKRYPVISWNHNLEPDMVNTSGEVYYKTYEVYRAHASNNAVPGNYYLIATVNINVESLPSYIDEETYALCSGGTSTEDFTLRYKVKAVDTYNDKSVYSDFVSIVTHDLNKGEEGDVFRGNGPKEYKLSQNYPNPFNPTTNINYEIPRDGIVTLKIYDILGRVVKVLVNEMKSAGRYTIAFTATEFSSGVYFYRLESNNFVEVKRMILLK